MLDAKPVEAGEYIQVTCGHCSGLGTVFRKNHSQVNPIVPGKIMTRVCGEMAALQKRHDLSNLDFAILWGQKKPDCSLSAKLRSGREGWPRSGRHAKDARKDLYKLAALMAVEKAGMKPPEVLALERMTA